MNKLKVGIEVVVALAAAAGKYEVFYGEDEKGIHIDLKSSNGMGISRMIPEPFCPGDFNRRSQYIAYEVKQAVIMLDDAVANGLKPANVPVTSIMVHRVGTGGSPNGG